jgi:hypothetical protein
VYFNAVDDGRFALVDNTNGGLLMEFSADGQTNTFNGTASGNLPLTGGEVKGDVSLLTWGAYERRLALKSDGKWIGFRVLKDGRFVLSDFTNSKSIFVNEADGTNTFNGTASGNIAKNGGGTIAGELQFKQYDNGYTRIFKNHSATGDHGSVFMDTDANGNKAAVKPVAKSNKLLFTDTSLTDREIHHDGNSKKVVVSDTAPSDTSAVWFDTSEV